MSRLHTELQRLYLLEDFPADGIAPALIDAQGRVRAIVVELARAVPWERVAAFWHQVQDEWGLPPPALAVSGRDGFQPHSQGHAPVGFVHLKGRAVELIGEYADHGNK